MKKTNIFLFAAFHLTKNIASQRFRSLAKYFDASKYRVHIFTQLPNQPEMRHVYPESNQSNIEIYPSNGECLGKNTSALTNTIILSSSFITKIPFRISNDRNSWSLQAIRKAEEIANKCVMAGEKSVVIGTYSPLDALVAACCISKKFNFPLLLDFRDGFSFESRGRKGWLASSARSIIENAVIQHADIVTTVSEPIVNYFQQRFTNKRIELLPNGYDSSDFQEMENTSASEKAKEIAQLIPKNKLLFGHFGRVSGSDASRVASLNHFIQSINQLPNAKDTAYLLFVGELTSNDLAILNKANCSKTILPSVDRSVAIELMKICPLLILITGDGVGCATGKVFEYMAAGSEIICFSAVKNEASNIIERTNCGSTIVAGEDPEYIALSKKINNTHPDSSGRPRDISHYNRMHQAKALSNWIDELSVAE